MTRRVWEMVAKFKHSFGMNEFSECRATRCVECGREPVTRWWLGKIELGQQETWVVAADCGSCSEAIRMVYLEGHKGAGSVRELSFEEVEVMRVMIS